MATVPRATVSVEPTAAAPPNGDSLLCLIGPVAESADGVPRLYGSAKALYEQHGYCEAVEYAALHCAEAGQGVLFAGLPIDTEGEISRFVTFGNTGSSVVTISEGSDGILAEHDGVLRVPSGGGGTIGTDQIKLELSLDGGRSFRAVRLGSATSYVLPYVNATVSFAAGDLNDGDTIAEWHGSAPMLDTADLSDLFDTLAEGNKLFRSSLVCSEFVEKEDAQAYASALNAYASGHDRFVFGRAQVGPDRFPQARLSHATGRMTGHPTLTFTASSDTVVRNAGSWLVDGFHDGDTVVIAGTVSNNGTRVVTTVTGTTLTFGNVIVDETYSLSAATLVASPTLVFAASGDTVVRNRGSWLVDGFRVADSVTIDGTTTNDTTLAAVTVTALTLTLANGLADQTIASSGVDITAGVTKAAWMAALDAEFEDVDSEDRIDLASGRGAKFSPFSGWFLRHSPAWAASIREYQHDLHIPSWRKADGPTGFDLFDANNELVEWDDRVDGGAASAARFTSFRTWQNPRGAFVAQSLTRAGDGQITSQTHNMAVVNAACTAVQAATENIVGRDLELNSDGTATKGALAVIAGEVNAALELAMLSNRGEGPRASRAVWTPDPTDVYNVPEAVMHGTLELTLRGTIHTVRTSVVISSAGQ